MICYSCLEIIPSGTTPIPLIFPNFLYTPKLLTLFLKYALFDRTVKPQGPVAGSVFFCRIWYYKHKRLQRKCDILTCCQGKILASPVLLCYTTFIVCGSGVSCCNSIMKSNPDFITTSSKEVYRHGTCLRSLQQRRAVRQQRQPLPSEDEAFLEAEHPARPRGRRRRGQARQRLHALPPFRQG